MYSTCLFCNVDLGSNETIEPFPVGRRLAFDAARGRLWVVCRKCERWNLSPLEERWEAIEECERAFRETRLRVSTDNIGLARVREGLELVRVGAALRPEFAAWRYGDQFGRRRQRHLLLTAAGVSLVGGVIVAGPVMGLIAGGSWAVINIGNTVHSIFEERRVRVRLRLPEHDRLLPIRRRQLNAASLSPGDDDGWSLRIPVAGGDAWWAAISSMHADTRRWRRDENAVRLTGRDALDAVGQLLPQLNAKGARRTEVQTAVRMIEDVGDPMRLFTDLARAGASTSRQRDSETENTLHTMPTETRLALEMASHEESERRAMEGELALLEAAWRSAEEVAAIADDLLVPDDVSERLGRTRRPAVQ